MVRGFSAVDLNETTSPGQKSGKSSAMSRAKTDGDVDQNNPPGMKGFRKMVPSEGQAAQAFMKSKKDTPVLGLHDLETTMRMNKNKFCTSVGHNSARDLE
jgi:hypothetical protein